MKSTCHISRIQLLFLAFSLLIPFSSTAQVTALEWAHSFGDNAYEYGNSIAVDNSGNVLVIGNFSATIDFNPGTDTNQLMAFGPDDIFFAKYASNGDFIFANQISCSGQARGNCIASDDSGNIYITGYFSQTTDFDPGPATYNVTASGTLDAFFATFDSAGNFLWVKTISGSTTVTPKKIKIGSSGDIYLAGDFQATADFDPDTAGSAPLTSQGGSDIFFARYSGSGDYIWAKSLGKMSSDFGTGIEIDTNGNVYVTGYYFGMVDFDPGPGTYNLNSLGASDIFFARYDSLGNFNYARQIASSSFDQSSDMVLDGNGNIILIGAFSQLADFDPGPGFASPGLVGALDVFIAKYDSSGNYIFAKGIGSTGIDEIRSVCTDLSDNIYVTGTIADTADFDPGPGSVVLNGAGAEDAFIASYDPQGAYRWAEHIAGTGIDKGTGMAVDNSGGIFVTGGFSDSIDFNHNQGIYTLQSFMNTDLYLAKYFRCTPDTILIAEGTCSPFVYDGQVYVSPGNYVIAYHPGLGCDSTIIIDLSIPVIDTSVNVNGVTLISGATGLNYQWIDCGNGNIPLPGDTGQSFTAIVNGSYAVVVSVNGCTDTSACVIVNNVGIDESNGKPLLIVYPQPVSDEINLLVSGNQEENITVEIYDIYGNLVKSLPITNITDDELLVVIDVADFTAGVYFIRLNLTGKIANMKIVKI